MRLRRGLSSQVLPCGCLVGIYETYDEAAVAVIDVRGPGCGMPGHRRHALVPRAASEPLPAAGRVEERSASKI